MTARAHIVYGCACAAVRFCRACLAPAIGRSCGVFASFLQKSLANNFQNAVALCLERLSFEVQNAITKHKNDPDTLPLYNPTLENVRNLINLGLHFTIYQENLSLNFPLYKKALWNLTQNLTKMYDIKHGVIEEWIVTNQQKYKILESCEDSIKQYR